MFPKFDKVINDEPQPSGSTSANTCINANVIRSQQCLEHKPNDLSYNEWAKDAERRFQAGQKQKQCSNCSLWFWEDEY